MKYLDSTRVEFEWEFPLAEIILDFYDRLKPLSRGYATLDYEFAGYRASDLVKLDMLINGEAVDAFSVIIHRDKAYEWDRKLAEKLCEPVRKAAVRILQGLGYGSWRRRTALRRWPSSSAPTSRFTS